MAKTKRAAKNTLKINDERLQQIRKKEDLRKLQQAKTALGRLRQTNAGPKAPPTAGTQGIPVSSTPYPVSAYHIVAMQ